MIYVFLNRKPSSGKSRRSYHNNRDDISQIEKKNVMQHLLSYFGQFKRDRENGGGGDVIKSILASMLTFKNTGCFVEVF